MIRKVRFSIMIEEFEKLLNRNDLIIVDVEPDEDDPAYVNVTSLVRLM